jgi:hypothetical protein
MAFSGQTLAQQPQATQAPVSTKAFRLVLVLGSITCPPSWIVQSAPLKTRITSELKGRKEYMPCFAAAAVFGGEQSSLIPNCTISEFLILKSYIPIFKQRLSGFPMC